jgi:uridine phosphorylase
MKNTLKQPHILCKKGDVSRFAIIPGDPARVRLISKYLNKPKEIAFNREFLTITGEYKGVLVTVTSTGIGCPSAAIAIEELSNIGVDTFIRVGTCGSLQKNIKPGDLIIPFAAIREEGTTQEYISSGFPAVSSPDVYQELIKSAQKLKINFFTGINRTHDAFYEHVNNFIKWADIYKDNRMKKWNYPLVSSEMECSVVFLLPMLRGLKSGCILTVNTSEPFEKIVEDSNSIYKLEKTKNTACGVDNAIKIALETIKSLSLNQSL